MICRFEPEMHLPIHFPSESDKIQKEVAEFRQLSSTDRLLRIFSLCAFGERLLKESPNRERALEMRRASEEDWQRIHRELFKRNGV